MRHVTGTGQHPSADLEKQKHFHLRTIIGALIKPFRMNLRLVGQDLYV